MAAHGEMKEQVETPTKMRAGVDSIPLAFEITGETARSETTEPQAERTVLGRRTSVGQQESKLPTQPARALVVDNPAWLSRRGEGLCGYSVASKTMQDYALAAHRKTTH